MGEVTSLSDPICSILHPVFCSHCRCSLLVNFLEMARHGSALSANACVDLHRLTALLYVRACGDQPRLARLAMTCPGGVLLQVTHSREGHKASNHTSKIMCTVRRMT